VVVLLSRCHICEQLSQRKQRSLAVGLAVLRRQSSCIWCPILPIRVVTGQPIGTLTATVSTNQARVLSLALNPAGVGMPVLGRAGGLYATTVTSNLNVHGSLLVDLSTESVNMLVSSLLMVLRIKIHHPHRHPHLYHQPLLNRHLRPQLSTSKQNLEIIIGSICGALALAIIGLLLY
jgi:hypothetical protein